jgi:hypothetical protein
VEDGFASFDVIVSQYSRILWQESPDHAHCVDISLVMGRRPDLNERHRNFLANTPARCVGIEPQQPYWPKKLDHC